MFRIGDKVRVHPNDDNVIYNAFRNKTLIITHSAYNKSQHPGYDSGLAGQGLHDLQTEDGEQIHVSLYDYELEKI